MTHSRVSIIFSLLFFALWTFTNITLFISQFSYSFSHLFLIFIRPNELFTHISTIIFLCGFCFGLGFVLVSSYYRSSDSINRVIMLCVSVIFIYLLIFNATTEESEYATDLFVLEGSIYHRGFFELIRAYFLRIVSIVLIYVFFVYMPLLFLIFGIRPNVNNRIGEMIDKMSPSMNVIIAVLFALALQPYYYRDNMFVYIDIIALFGGVGLLIYTMKKHKALFGFYEKVNFALLILGIIMCIVCSSTLSISEYYFNARYTFLVFALVGWCIEWMHKSVSTDEE